MDTAEFGLHICEDRLEEYAFGRLPEPELGVVEEHLFVCERCQDALAGLDDFRALMRAGVSLPKQEPAGVPSHWLLRTLAGAVAVAGVAALMIMPRMETRQSEVVRLAAIRGDEITRMHARRSAELRIAVPDLEDGHYRIEVVNERGGPVWSGMGVALGGEIRITEPKSLGRGTYWVRLYSSTGLLLHEYGIEAAL